MVTLPGITIQIKIYESYNYLVYRGIRDDGRALVIKMLKQDYPSPQELIRYKQEYKITRSLNLQGVVKAYSQQDYQTHTHYFLRRLWRRVPRAMEAQASRELLPDALIHVSGAGDGADR